MVYRRRQRFSRKRAHTAANHHHAHTHLKKGVMGHSLSVGHQSLPHTRALSLLGTHPTSTDTAPSRFPSLLSLPLLLCARACVCLLRLLSLHLFSLCSLYTCRRRHLAVLRTHAHVLPDLLFAAIGTPRYSVARVCLAVCPSSHVCLPPLKCDLSLSSPAGALRERDTR